MKVPIIISRIRICAFFLFLTATIALLGSLFFHNYLVNVNYKLDFNYSKYLKDTPGSSYLTNCNEQNNFCYYDGFHGTKFLNEKSKKLNDCFIHKVDRNYKIADDAGISEINYFARDELFELENGKYTPKKEFKDNQIFFISKVSNDLNKTCIKNMQEYSFYKAIPFFFEFIGTLQKKGYSLGTSEKVNPFVYGELSISNMVKRFPINFVFKSFLYISVILMIFYWINYGKIFKELISPKKYSFLFFGIGSAIFLFFHVLFLGLEIDSKLFKQLRRIIIVLFILFEILAQFFLAINLNKNKNIFQNYCYINIINLKLYFVYFVLIFSAIIIFILIMFNLPNKVDYILEWNYFLGLLIFYFMSAIIWKKLI